MNETDKKQAAIDFADELMRTAIDRVRQMNIDNGEDMGFPHLVAAFVGSATNYYVARKMMEHSESLQARGFTALDDIKNNGFENRDAIFKQRMDANVDAFKQGLAKARKAVKPDSAPHPSNVIAESDVIALINGTPELTGILYDMDLLPEQLACTSPRWQHMLNVVRDWISDQNFKQEMLRRELDNQ